MNEIKKGVKKRLSPTSQSSNNVNKFDQKDSSDDGYQQFKGNGDICFSFFDRKRKLVIFIQKHVCFPFIEIIRYNVSPDFPQDMLNN